MAIERGERVELRPGWDCHGLPIEQKALVNAQGKSFVPLKLRSLCKRFAQEAIERQVGSMQRWGLLAEYDRPVFTMDPLYEAHELEIFAKFVETGLVFTDKRPVFWSPSSRTALAEAELEYVEDHKSRACFAKFPLIGSDECNLLIWTTTPWTLPANQGIAFNSRVKYVKISCQGSQYLVAESRVASLKGSFPDIEIVKEIDTLNGLCYWNPITETVNRLIEADFVTEDSGTGLVHLAPAYGQDDFRVCRQDKDLQLVEIVDEQGKFTPSAPSELVGLDIFDDIHHVVDCLKAKGLIVRQEDHLHRYPYDWRSRKPVVQMAANQWFIQTGSIKDRLLKALDEIEFVPASGKKRFANMIESRSEWCISRQRLWGVPIPVFYWTNSRQSLLDAEAIRHVAQMFKVKGSDAWWSLDTVDLLPEKYKPMAKDLEKGTDTFDVWFDSGAFWQISPQRPADVYIEGSDQFRGWFQSSLISSVVARQIPPTKMIIAHGFVLDEKGAKMSKSLGNVLDPEKVIERAGHGTDVLRLWAANSNFLHDVSIDYALEVRNKLRNTFRFLLGNIHDLPNDNPYIPLKSLDRIFLNHAQYVLQSITDSFNRYEFSQGLSTLQSFINEDLSTVYLDSIKNRLYLPAASSMERRSAQRSLAHIVNVLLRALRPVTPILCAEVMSHGPLHFESPLTVDSTTNSIALSWDDLKSVRAEIFGHINRLRSQRLITSSFELNCHLNEASIDKDLVEPFEDLLMTAAIKFTLGQGSLANGVMQLKGREIAYSLLRSELAKCPRCWVYRKPIEDELCPPCDTTLNRDPSKLSNMK